MLFYFLPFSLLYGQNIPITHGDFKAEQALRKLYDEARVVSCQIFSNEKDKENPQLILSQEYDREGKMTQELEFEYNVEKEANDTFVNTFTYDAKGLLSGYNTGRYDIMGGYIYNDKNELRYYGMSGAEARTFSFVYKKGLLIQEIGNGATQLTEEGRPNWTKFEERFFEYNHKKQRVGEKYYFFGNLSVTKEYVYDKKGYLSQEKMWYGEKTGEPYNILTYSYGDNHLLTAIQNTEEGVTLSYKYTYSDW